MILLADIRKTDTYLGFLENSIIFVEPISRLIWSIISPMSWPGHKGRRIQGKNSQ